MTADRLGEVVVAVDVGGSTIKGITVDPTGRVCASHERPTPTHRPVADVVAEVDAVVDALTTAARRTAHRVAAVGIAVPGDVDEVAGVARYSANLGWRDVPADAFTGASSCGAPVVLGHDVRCAALAERTFGETRDVAYACIVVIGTGIASVSLAGGLERRGSSDRAGELGHIPVHPDGEVCRCGQRGCLEVYASAGGVALRYAAATGRTLSTAEIVGLLPTDDDAAAVWAQAVDALAAALVTVTMLDDPEVVVLAGGLSEAGAALLVPLREKVGAGLTWRPPPRVEISLLGARAGRYGIALVAARAAGWVRFETWAGQIQDGRR